MIRIASVVVLAFAGLLAGAAPAGACAAILQWKYCM